MTYVSSRTKNLGNLCILMRIELSQLIYLNTSMCNYAIFQDREVQKFSNS
jgi:hypothetical protein